MYDVAMYAINVLPIGVLFGVWDGKDTQLVRCVFVCVEEPEVQMFLGSAICQTNLMFLGKKNLIPCESVIPSSCGTWVPPCH